MSAQFIDKAGRPVKPGDIIVYGHALGRCAALQYGKALALKTVTKSRWVGGSEGSKKEEYVHLSVQGVTCYPDYSGCSLIGKGTLQFGERTLIVTRDQVPAHVLKVLDEVKVESAELVCEDCGKVGGDVKETTCPFSAEIHDEKVPATLCNTCEHERGMEV